MLKHIGKPSTQLILCSFLMLFTELVLIRYTSANFIYLAFLTNYILIASFLGIAAGFMLKNECLPLFRLSPIMLALLIFLCHRYCYEYQININPLTDDLDFYTQTFQKNALPLLLTLPAIFIAVTITMACIASGTANAFRRLPSLRAYQLEILGSLLGVITFSTMSWLHASPLIWAVAISLLFSLVLIKQSASAWLWRLLQVAALAVLTITFYQESTVTNKIWSAYYKIHAIPYTHDRYAINVNGLPQQLIESVSQRKAYKPFYLQPYQHLSAQHALNRVLIIGAGTGGDVAIALAQGAQHVDAVEIDQALADLGKQLNPDQPYADPRVSLYINDGRAFLEQTKQKYDLIIIALADSLTLIAGQSSIRLENYLLTLESMQTIRNHLQPDGALAMYNYYRNSWIVDRLGGTLQSAFNQTPCLDTKGERGQWQSVLTVSQQQNILTCQTHWTAYSDLPPKPSTDNHPFFYMEFNDISVSYLFCLLFILGVTFTTIKISGGSVRDISTHFDLFLLGAAFMLLEAKNIVQFSLLFGTTWNVNALVFIGVLAIILISTVVTQRSRSLPISYLLLALLASLLLCWLIPSHWLLSLPWLLRFITASFISFTPILFANLIFAARFKLTTNSSDAFSANMLGCIIGGLLEYSSLIIGYQNLLIMVAAIYCFAVFTMLLRKDGKRWNAFYLQTYQKIFSR